MSDRPASIRTPRGAAEDERESLLGPQLLQCLHAVLRGLRLYSSANQALRDHLQDLTASIASVMDGDVTLIGMGEHFFLNGVRLKPDPDRVNLRRSLIAEFETRGLGGLRFTQGLTTAELETFFRCFVNARDAAQGQQLADTATRAGVLHAVPVRLGEMGSRLSGVERAADGGSEAEGEVGAEGGAEGDRRRAGQNFRNALQGTRSLIAHASRTGRPALHRARRLVQPIVDSILNDEFSIIGLTAMKNHDEYTYAHCVNVSVLSISMGQTLGLPRQALANLGVAALLHDLGKLMVPAEVLRKPGKLAPDEWERIQRHPLDGVKMISRLPGLMPLTLDCMRAAFQHHMNADRSGYPRVQGGGTQAVLSRIVTAADLFDALTSHRAYRERPFTGFEALRFVLNQRRQHLDPGVVWALIKTVGLYPAGTVMLTESGCVVMSLSPNPRDLRRPHCRVLLRPDSSRRDPQPPEAWDPMPADERVARVLGPEEFAVNTNALLAA
jgi:HD-GYP domain-containing protein (c-di-GMP phosphodiesterase class II)